MRSIIAIVMLIGCARSPARVIPVAAAPLSAPASASASSPPPVALPPPEDVVQQTTAATVGNVPAARGIAVGGGSLWVTSLDGAIHRIPLNGAPPSIVASPDRPTYVCTSSTHVYWTDLRKNASDPGRVSRMPFSSGAIELVADNLHSPAGCTIAGDRMHFVEQQGAPTVWMASAGAKPIIVASEPKQRAAHVAAHGTRVCWTTALRPNVICKSGNEPSRALTDGEPKGMLALAIDETHAFWVTGTCGLNAASLNGGTARPLGGRGDMSLTVSDVVLDATHAYWICGGTVRRVSKSGGDPTVIYRDPNQILMGIAADEKHVYVTGTKPTVVLSVAKQ